MHGLDSGPHKQKHLQFLAGPWSLVLVVIGDCSSPLYMLAANATKWYIYGDIGTPSQKAKEKNGRRASSTNLVLAPSATPCDVPYKRPISMQTPHFPLCPALVTVCPQLSHHFFGLGGPLEFPVFWLAPLTTY